MIELRPAIRHGVIPAALITLAIGLPQLCSDLGQDVFSAFAVLAAIGLGLCWLLHNRHAISYLKSCPVAIAGALALALVPALSGDDSVLHFLYFRSWVIVDDLSIPFRFVGWITITLPYCLAKVHYWGIGPDQSHPAIYLSMDIVRLSLYVNVAANSVVGGLIARRLAVIATEPAAPAGAPLRPTAWLRLGSPVLALLFYPLYWPIDRHYTVKYLGCGCHQGFNDNCLNFIIGTVVLIVAWALLSRASGCLAGRTRVRYLVIGGAILCLVNAYLATRQVWL